MRVKVDLREPRIIDAIRDRFDTLFALAEELENDGYLEVSEVGLVPELLLQVSEGYALLNEAYKADVLRYPPEDPFGTSPPKIAAMTAITIAQFRPFRILDLFKPVQLELSLLAN
jgi:hypothetical protein